MVAGAGRLDNEVKRVKSTVVAAAENDPKLLVQLRELEQRIDRGKLLNDISVVEQAAQKGQPNAPAAD